MKSCLPTSASAAAEDAALLRSADADPQSPSDASMSPGSSPQQAALPLGLGLGLNLGLGLGPRHLGPDGDTISYEGRLSVLQATSHGNGGVAAADMADRALALSRIKSGSIFSAENLSLSVSVPSVKNHHHVRDVRSPEAEDDYDDHERHHDDDIAEEDDDGPGDSLDKLREVCSKRFTSAPTMVSTAGTVLRPTASLNNDQEDSNPNTVFQCHVCSYSGTSRSEFKAHLTQHYEFMCPKCDFSSKSEDDFHQHLKVEHDLNPEDLEDQQGLTIPRINSQGKPKTFRCKQCDFYAYTKYEFWSHSRAHIKPEKMLTCPRCPFVTEFKHHLDYHMRNHTGSKPFKCPSCTYACVNKSMLNSHMKSHTNVYQYRCADCNYASKYCHSLKMHLRKYRHSPSVVLNSDGTPNPLNIIDVYGTRRGPKVKKGEHLTTSPTLLPPVTSAASAMTTSPAGLAAAAASAMTSSHLSPAFPMAFPMAQMFQMQMQMQLQSAAAAAALASADKKPLKCHICPFSSTSSQVLNNHLRLHEQKDRESPRGLAVSSPQLEAATSHIKVEREEPRMARPEAEEDAEHRHSDLLRVEYLKKMALASQVFSQQSQSGSLSSSPSPVGSTASLPVSAPQPPPPAPHPAATSEQQHQHLLSRLYLENMMKLQQHVRSCSSSHDSDDRDEEDADDALDLSQADARSHSTNGSSGSQGASSKSRRKASAAVIK